MTKPSRCEAGRHSSPTVSGRARSIISRWSAAGRRTLASSLMDPCPWKMRIRPARCWRNSAPAAPFDLVIPDGLVGDLTRYMIATARRPQPLLSLGASLCAIGALMGRLYRTESNLRSNLYVVGIADSGSGKNHAREIVNEVFFEAGLANHLGGNKIASGAGLLTALHRQPAILFRIDEFGMFLSAAADRKRSPRHITEILDNMTELFTAAGGIFLGAEYANRDGMNERRDIVEPCLSVYGTTTPLHFWGALQGANVADGSLARFLILPSEDSYPDENLAAGLREAPRELLEGLQRIAAGGGRQRGNLVGKTSGASAAVDAAVVPMTGDARTCFAMLSRELTVELRSAAGTAFTSILARIGENAMKLALIIAVGRDSAQPVIEMPNGPSASCDTSQSGRWTRSSAMSRTPRPRPTSSASGRSSVRRAAKASPSRRSRAPRSG